MLNVPTLPESVGVTHDVSMLTSDTDENFHGLVSEMMKRFLTNRVNRSRLPVHTHAPYVAFNDGSIYRVYIALGSNPDIDATNRDYFNQFKLVRILNV